MTALTNSRTEAAGTPSAGPMGRQLDRALLCLVLDDLAARTSRVLHAAGIDHLLIKGQVTAHLLYPGDPSRRFHTDVDLLVHPDRFGAAQEALAAAGYRSASSGLRSTELSWEQRVWLDPDQHLFHVDLHRGFHGVTRPARFFEALWADRGSIRLSGRSVPTPGRVAAILMVLLHATETGASRKPAIDLQHAATLLDTDTLSATLTLARECGAVGACTAALRSLGATVPDSLADHRTPAVHWMWLHDRPAPSVQLARLLSQPGLRRQIGFVVARLTPSVAALRRADARAQRRTRGWRAARSPGRPAGPGGLVGAYLRRLWPAVRGLPRAVLDVRAAHRAGARFQLPDEPDPAPGPPILPTAIPRAVVSPTDRWRAATWATRSWRHVHRGLRTGPPELLRVPAPPTPKARGVVLVVLRLVRASCLERSLVLQRFDAADGRRRDVVVGVTRRGGHTRAHAWLDGEDPQGDFLPIHRYPAPADQAAPR